MIVSYLRTILLYLVLIGVIRVMGKRQIGQMEPAEFVVTMLVANLASIPMQDGGIPLFSGLVPILTVLGVELLLSFGMLKSMGLRRLLCGKPVILIENGRILQSHLRRTRVTVDELMGHLREKDVLDPRQVQYAILETDGTLSVFPRQQPAEPLPVCLIEDGKIIPRNLTLLGRDEAWLQTALGEHTAEDTFLLIQMGDELVWIGKEEGQ